jgi:hypothetical protein
VAVIWNEGDKLISAIREVQYIGGSNNEEA